MQVRDISVVSYDDTNGYVGLDPVSFPGMHPGLGYFRLDAVATSPAAYHLERPGWIGKELYQSNSALTPAYAGGTVIRFSFNGLDVDPPGTSR